MNDPVTVLMPQLYEALKRMVNTAVANLNKKALKDMEALKIRQKKFEDHVVHVLTEHRTQCAGENNNIRKSLGTFMLCGDWEA